MLLVGNEIKIMLTDDNNHFTTVSEQIVLIDVRHVKHSDNG